MELPAWAYLNSYTILLAAMLLHTSLSASRSESNRAYLRFLIVLISLLIMDSFSRLAVTQKDFIYCLMRAGNF